MHCLDGVSSHCLILMSAILIREWRLSCSIFPQRSLGTGYYTPDDSCCIPPSDSRMTPYRFPFCNSALRSVCQSVPARPVPDPAAPGVPQQCFASALILTRFGCLDSPRRIYPGSLFNSPLRNCPFSKSILKGTLWLKIR